MAISYCVYIDRVVIKANVTEPYRYIKSINLIMEKLYFIYSFLFSNDAAKELTVYYHFS